MQKILSVDVCERQINLTLRHEQNWVDYQIWDETELPLEIRNLDFFFQQRSQKKVMSVL